MKAATIHTLRDLVRDLKVDALHSGRYPKPCKAELWEQRDKSKAFRCIAYSQNVRRINAIEDAISVLEDLARKDSTRLTDEAVNSVSCNASKLHGKREQS
jgi:hypothetical protein